MFKERDKYELGEEIGLKFKKELIGLFKRFTKRLKPIMCGDCENKNRCSDDVANQELATTFFGLFLSCISESFGIPLPLVLGSFQEKLDETREELAKLEALR